MDQDVLDELIGLTVSFVESVEVLHFMSDEHLTVEGSSMRVLSVNSLRTVVVLPEELLDAAASAGRLKLSRWLLENKCTYLIVPDVMYDILHNR